MKEEKREWRMTNKSQKRGSYVAKFLKQGEYLQQTENVNVKKERKREKGFMFQQ